MRYEFKKLFSSVQMLICFALLIAFLAFFVVQSYRSRDLTQENYTKLINEFSEKYTDENDLMEAIASKRFDARSKINSEGEKNAFKIKGEYSENLMSDFFLLENAESYANYIYKEIPKHRKNIIKDSLYEIEETSENSLKTKYQTAVKKYNMKINTPFVNTGNINSSTLFFDFTIWDYAMMAFIIMLTVRMFILDRESGTYKVVYSSYYGKGKLFANQLSVCLVTAVMIVILHMVCQLVCGKIFYGVNNLSLPIQSYEYFEFCPFNITLGEYFLIKTLGKILLAVSVVSITAMITCLSRKNILSIVLSIVIVAGTMLFNTRFYLSANGNSGSLIKNQKDFTAIRTFLPACLLKPDEYFKSLDYVIIFNVAVPRFCCVCIIAVLISIVCVIISYKSFSMVRKG